MSEEDIRAEVAKRERLANFVGGVAAEGKSALGSARVAAQAESETGSGFLTYEGLKQRLDAAKAESTGLKQ